MLFNSFDYLIFIIIVFFVYWIILKSNRVHQNILLLISSYVFYGWWDWRFLSLIIFSTLVDFIIGIQLGKAVNERKRKLLLFTSLGVNLGFLGIFKYFDFFLANFYELFPFLQDSVGFNSLDIILPVGISFYTFQTLSYSIDVYRKNLEPCKDFIAFSSFVSFFPQLVAGPIERAQNLLPQFTKDRKFNFNRAVDGTSQILWGLFKKMVIADNCAALANNVFNSPQDFNGITLLLAGVLFAFQIYGDFSGYSDIAIGTARIFGFNLMKNFAFPYFSRDIAEFWRRWHISLSTWFRDYLYIPLGGSRGSTFKKVRNTIIIFVVSGFWHGANWTFIIWGFLNALYFIPLLLSQNNRKYVDEVVASGKRLPNLRELFSMLSTFTITVFAWIIFRSDNVQSAYFMIKKIFSQSIVGIPEFEPKKVYVLMLIIAFIIIEWIGRRGEYGIQFLRSNPKKYIRYSVYFIIFCAIAIFSGGKQEFIYFQF